MKTRTPLALLCLLICNQWAVGNGVPTHLCPFDYLDDTIRESTLQRFAALQKAWESYRRTPVEG